MTQGALAFSKIVDVDPTSYIIRNDVATVALERGIDQMCQRLDIIAQLREQGHIPPGLYQSLSVRLNLLYLESGEIA